MRTYPCLAWLLSILPIACGQGPNGQPANEVACAFDEAAFIYRYQSALCQDGSAWVSPAKGGLTITDLNSGKKTALAVENLRCSKIVFSPNGKAVLTDLQNGDLVMLEIITGRERLRLPSAHEDSLKALVFSPDGLVLASTADDHSMKVWDLTNGKCLASRRTSKDERFSLSLSHDANTLFFVDRAIVRSWRYAKDKTETLLTHPGLGQIAVSPNEDWIATADYCVIKVWDMRTLKEKQHFGASAGVRRIFFSADGTLLIVGLEDGGVNVWDFVNNKVKYFSAEKKTPIDFVALTPSDELVVPISQDQLKRWKLSSERWQGAPTPAQATEKRNIELKKQRDELTARMRKEIDGVPARIRKASTRKELDEALAPFHHHLVETNTFVGHEKMAADPAWRDDFLRALKDIVAGQDPDMASTAAHVIVNIPGEKTRTMIVDAFKEQKPYALVFIENGLSHRLSEFSLEEKRALVPLLLKTERNGRMDAVLLKIPDARVLPAFFALLDRDQDDKPLKKQEVFAASVSWALIDLFRASKLDVEIPPEIRLPGAAALNNTDPLRAADLWRAWYKANGKHLVWDEQALRYTLKR